MAWKTAARRPGDPRRAQRRAIGVCALAWVGALAVGGTFAVEVAVVVTGVAVLGLGMDRLARTRPRRRARRALRRGRLDDVLMDHDGAAFERLCAEALRACGARVIEQGGGGDQGADLLVDWQGRRWVIQCKRRARTVGNDAIQQVYAARSYYRADAAAVMTNRGFTRGAWDLARRTGVELVGRHRLEDMLVGKARRIGAEVS